jgi:hypothetical protein
VKRVFGPRKSDIRRALEREVLGKPRAIAGRVDTLERRKTQESTGP